MLRMISTAALVFGVSNGVHVHVEVGAGADAGIAGIYVDTKHDKDEKQGPDLRRVFYDEKTKKIDIVGFHTMGDKVLEGLNMGKGTVTEGDCKSKCSISLDLQEFIPQAKRPAPAMAAVKASYDGQDAITFDGDGNTWKRIAKADFKFAEDSDPPVPGKHTTDITADAYNEMLDKMRAATAPAPEAPAKEDKKEEAKAADAGSGAYSLGVTGVVAAAVAALLF